MDWKEITVEKKEGMATVSLNRPEHYNALSPSLLQELRQAMEGCAADNEIRAVILTGTGKAFCSGGDLRAMKENFSDPGKLLLGMVDDVNRLVISIRRMSKPVIAAINGAVGGAGISIAAACDLRVASVNAKYRQAYTSNGISVDAGWSAFVPHLIGMGRASELLLLDPVFTSEEAYQYGLVNRIVPESEVLSTAQQWAEKLSTGPIRSYAQAKTLLNASMLPDLETQLEKEREGIAAIVKTSDFREGVQAFLEKRTPQFSGC
ncbi:MAG: enoyl-CoA hydratase/isomerase family protein [Bacillota bacterium]